VETDERGSVTEGDLVTVLVPARDEEQSIGQTLDSIVRQTYRHLQIVVVDDGSTDRTAEIVRRRATDDARIELVSSTRRGIPAALNQGLDVARGIWLVRVDAHSTIAPDYVTRLLAHLDRGGWGGVGGRKDGVGETAQGRAIAAALGSRFGVGNSKYHYATEVEEVDHLPFGAYRVDVVRRLGGWDERLVANEDFEFDFRLRQSGERLLLDPEIVIAWQCRQSIGICGASTCATGGPRRTSPYCTRNPSVRVTWRRRCSSPGCPRRRSSLSDVRDVRPR
jgi:glycosyltransferase involved in cell wall biosynthesis